ncbi:MAG: response regulator [candidate division Zixibacteria bacterium]|nr:response regulator [candidate division Zixibacteria bacterium]
MKRVNPRVLIVESKKRVALEIKEMLHQYGYEVVGTAFTAKEAYKLAGKRNPDLILTNIEIQKEMDGIKLAEELSDKYMIPAVYMNFSKEAPAFDEKELLHRIELALSIRNEKNALV